MTTPGSYGIPVARWASDLSVSNSGSNSGMFGATGSLGTNALQQEMDRLTRSVDNLTTAVQNLSSNMGAAGGPGSSAGGSLGGRATRQQGAGLSSGFPAMINPFQSSSRQMGIGGGGPGGAGNISGFGALGLGAAALLGFGNTNKMNLINLNTYATQSMIGANTGGLSRGQAMQAMYQQAGFAPGSANNLGLSQQDSLNSMAALQQRAGSQFIRQTSIGRATLGAQAAFGTMNPALGATGSANIASALYSPAFSMNAMMLGYKPILSQNGKAPMNQAQAAMSILSWMGLSNTNASNVFGNLSSGKGQANLSALFGSSGISNPQASQWLTGIATLSYNKHMTVDQINQLFTNAASGTTAVAKRAQATLSQYGISPAASDIQALKNNAASVQSRQGLYADDFNNGLEKAAGLLTQFNNAITSFLSVSGLGGPLGAGGGFSTIMAGANSSTGLLSSAAMLRMMRRGGGGGLGGTTEASLFEGAGGVGASSALAGMLSPLIVGAAGAIATAAVTKAIGDTVAPKGSVAAASGTRARKVASSVISPTSTGGGTFLDFPGISNILGWFTSGFNSNPATKGGGAAPVSSSKTTQTRSASNMSSSNGSARSAIAAAESQLGVPYKYGAEIPGVGFDCSALVQWAYKQAGVSLPRTSQEQWKSLSGRSIPLDKVQAGDLVFTAGADGSLASPGHVGMMISGSRLIEAPHTGANVEVIGYSPNAWQHAARPAGSGAFIAGSAASTLATGGSSVFAGNSGLGGTVGGTYGSVNEADIIAAMGSGGMARGSGASNGSSGSVSTNTSTASAVGGGSTSIPKGASQIVAAAKRMAQGYGWASGVQWNDFLKVVNHEDASWSPTATNPNGGAYGIPQALPGSKMASAGSDWRTNPSTQLKWMFNYIRQTYTDPVGAWGHEQKFGWYSAGGNTLPGMALVGERGPELMMTSGGQKVFSNSQTMQLINAIRGSSPAQSPWKTDATSGGSTVSTGHALNVNFSQGSIVFNGSGTTKTEASSAAREVTRQIVKHLNDEAVHQAIRNGDKL